MGQINVNVVGLQAGEAVFNFAHDVEAREAGVVWPISHGTVDLGGQHNLISSPFEGLTDNPFASAAIISSRVLVGAVDEIDAKIDGAVNRREANVLVRGTAKGRSQTDARNLNPRCTEISILHKL